MQRHRTLPIPQVVPGPSGQADEEPGVMTARSVHRGTQPLDTKTDHKSPFRTPVFRRRQNERGISGAMAFDAHRKRQLTIPTPVRSSLAQVFNNYKVQVSHYISRVRPFGMAPGYPTAHVLSLINTSPMDRRLAPKPHVGGARAAWANAGASANRPSGGSYYMNAPRRFVKALPVRLNTYEPPTY